MYPRVDSYRAITEGIARYKPVGRVLLNEKHYPSIMTTTGVALHPGSALKEPKLKDFGIETEFRTLKRSNLRPKLRVRTGT
jgi:hypothetical protein